MLNVIIRLLLSCNGCIFIGDKMWQPSFVKNLGNVNLLKNNTNFHSSRLDINDPERLPFEMDTAYEPNEWGNNLKIGLIQKREEFSDSPLPRMYDTELIRYDNSHSEVVTKFKVIKNTYCNLFVSVREKYFASAF